MENNRIILPMAAVVAVLYTVCFIGPGLAPQLAFPVFWACTLALLVFALRKMQLLANKKALRWLIPMGFLAAFNAVFNADFFTYGNIPAMHVLLAVFILNALNPELDIWRFAFLEKILLVILGNWHIFLSKLTEVFGKKEGGKTHEYLLKILTGVCLSVPLLFFVGALLLSADRIFSKIVEDTLSGFFNMLDVILVLRIIVGMLVFIYTGGFIYNAVKRSAAYTETVRAILKSFNIDIIISNTVLVLLNAMFLCFSIVQFAFLFTGGYMKLPEGVVYSSYAREGFFQLLFVTVINFGVLLFFTAVVENIQNHKLLRLLLMMLCGFTLVLVASSFYRMFLYMGTYGYTALRMSVITFLVMEVFLLGYTLKHFAHRQLNLFKAYALIGLIFYLIVNITGSNYFSMRMNLLREDVLINTSEPEYEVHFTPQWQNWSLETWMSK